LDPNQLQWFGRVLTLNFSTELYGFFDPFDQFVHGTGLRVTARECRHAPHQIAILITLDDNSELLSHVSSLYGATGFAHDSAERKPTLFALDPGVVTSRQCTSDSGLSTAL
jgi:hypothetical protein